MKCVVYRLSFILVLVLTLFLLFNLDANATNIANEMGFGIPNGMEVIVESEQNSYDIKYNKNYWTAHNKGVYNCAKFSTWQGAYKYYDSKSDILYIYLASFCITSPLDRAISIAPSARVRNKSVYQEISISQPNINTSSISTILLDFSPQNVNGTWSETLGLTFDSNGNLIPSYSVTVDHTDIEWVVNYSKDLLKVNYNYTRYSSSNDACYIGSNIHRSSYYFCIKNAKNYENKILNFLWDYRADYYIDDAGWENYNASSSDSNNNLDLKRNYSYTIKL